jgi:recombination endonuclease VII
MSIIKCSGPCGRELEHNEENFYVLHGRLRIRCKQCHGLAVKRWHDAHPEHYERYQKGWVKAAKMANPELWRAREFRNSMRAFGKTPEWYNEQFERQKGLCAICQLPEVEVHPRTGNIQRLSVDHNHTCCPGARSCGKCVRGLICAKCNQCLHQVEEVSGWCEKALAYLSQYS